MFSLPPCHHHHRTLPVPPDLTDAQFPFPKIIRFRLRLLPKIFHADPLINFQLTFQIRQLHKKVKRSVPWIPPRSKFEGNASAIASRGLVENITTVVVKIIDCQIT